MVDVNAGSGGWLVCRLINLAGLDHLLSEKLIKSGEQRIVTACRVPEGTNVLQHFRLGVGVNEEPGKLGHVTALLTQVLKVLGECVQGDCCGRSWPVPVLTL